MLRVERVWFERLPGGVRLEIGPVDALTEKEAAAVSTMVARVRNHVRIGKIDSAPPCPVGCSCSLSCDVREMRRLHSLRGI